MPHCASPQTSPLFWAPQAWIDGRWHYCVCLEIDAKGYWSSITTDTTIAPATATVLRGPVLPGMVNAHSHAFQRAFAGLSERREFDTDDFWSWRDRMYGVALRISPAQMRTVAAHLYVELLKGGYTQVCEFHYLHHSESGAPYADPASMSLALADGATDAGIGLTVLPVLYERAGFSNGTLRHDQRRFAGTPEFITELCRSMAHTGRPHVNAGISIHSLRAATSASIVNLLKQIGDDDVPIHIHIAEQMQEVRDCLTNTGLRPIQWLCNRLPLDERWQLVHATHTQPTEIDAVAASGAGIVICPSTEGNLGDGFADLANWMQQGVPMAIGSDSHVCRGWNEELRWLEYGQRMLLQRRNVAASPSTGQPSTAARLFEVAQLAGGTAAGQKLRGLKRGARADMVVLDPKANGLLGIPSNRTLDAYVFSCDTSAIQDVYVAGRCVVEQGRHARQELIASKFAQSMLELSSEFRG